MGEVGIHSLIKRPPGSGEWRENILAAEKEQVKPTWVVSHKLIIWYEQGWFRPKFPAPHLHISVYPRSLWSLHRRDKIAIQTNISRDGPRVLDALRSTGIYRSRAQVWEYIENFTFLSEAGDPHPHPIKRPGIRWFPHACKTCSYTTFIFSLSRSNIAYC